eukprot:SAG11_NODE_23637_length_385_cov_0.888112_1_plen_80_part_01
MQCARGTCSWARRQDAEGRHGDVRHTLPALHPIVQRREPRPAVSLDRRPPFRAIGKEDDPVPERLRRLHALHASPKRVPF